MSFPTLKRSGHSHARQLSPNCWQLVPSGFLTAAAGHFLIASPTVICSPHFSRTVWGLEVRCTVTGHCNFINFHALPDLYLLIEVCNVSHCFNEVERVRPLLEMRVEWLLLGKIDQYLLSPPLPPPPTHTPLPPSPRCNRGTKLWKCSASLRCASRYKRLRC